MRSDATFKKTNSPGPKQAAVIACLRAAIETALPKAAVRIWHGMPVWFIGENPIVGYSFRYTIVRLRFWNGQSFGDPRLVAVGKFRAAQIRYRDVTDIDMKALRRWLKIAKTDIWDMVGTRAKMLAACERVSRAQSDV
jgi:hypothetical protein